jgi:hypothetical protein
MRLGFDGLYQLVVNRLKADPLSGHPPQVLLLRLRLRIPCADSSSATDKPQAQSQGGPSSPGSPRPTLATRLAGWTRQKPWPFPEPPVTM